MPVKLEARGRLRG